MKTICLYSWEPMKNPKTGRYNLMWKYKGQWKSKNTDYTHLTEIEGEKVKKTIRKIRDKTGATSFKITIYSPNRMHTNLRFRYRK